MKNIVYVNGGIVIETPYFKYLNAKAKWEIPPDEYEVIEPDNEINGQPCIIITEKKAPTFFKGYYAKTFFSTKCVVAPFFSSSIEDSFSYFETKIHGVSKLLNQNDTSQDTRLILYNLSLVATISALDTYISDLVLYISTKNRNIFLETAQKYCQNNKAANIIARIAQMWSDNIMDSAEQEVIDSVLKTSYSNLKRIQNEVLKDLYQIREPKLEDIDEIFKLRHLIVHRSGKQKDGKEIYLSKEDLLGKIERIESVALTINNLVKNSKVVELCKR